MLCFSVAFSGKSVCSFAQPCLVESREAWQPSRTWPKEPGRTFAGGFWEDLVEFVAFIS